MYYAHSASSADRSDWQRLADHLHNVAALAGRFGAKFEAEQLAGLAGILHDLGKYSEAFQAYIEGRGQSPDHSTAGAQEVRTLARTTGDMMAAWLAAYAIAGHHGGLPDGTWPAPSLTERLKKPVPPLSPVWREEVRPDAESLLPRWFKPRPTKEQTAFSLAFLGRMIFSCLVDADRLDTEDHAARVEGRTVDRAWPDLRDRIDDLIAAFDTSMAAKLAALPEAARQSDVNRRRADILAHARGKASLPKGVFTLDVPTGGGKTLASLAFALDHARCHRMERIIYGIPFTGAWIETEALRDCRHDAPGRSRRGRGSVDRNIAAAAAADARGGRSPRGSVDRNTCSVRVDGAKTCRSPRGSVDRNDLGDTVAKLVEEGRSPRGSVDRNVECRIYEEGDEECRSPRGGVDRNSPGDPLPPKWAESLPSRERGSKQYLVSQLSNGGDVAPLAGAWIETSTANVATPCRKRRSPRGSVDQNAMTVSASM